MMLTRHISKHKQKTRGLFFFLALLVSVSFLEAQTRSAEGVRLANLGWRVQGDVVYISYDLLAPSDQEYEVTIVLLRESDRSFKIVPKSLTGSVGEGKFAGQSREIKWEFKKDVPRVLAGEGYYFEISVEPVGGSNTLLYVGLGVAAVGGAAAVLLGGKKGGDETSTPTATELPAPPSRPTP